MATTDTTQTVKINTAVENFDILDQSDLRRTYEYDGQVYTVVGAQHLPVPQEVAIGWLAHDSFVERYNDSDIQA